MFTSAEKKYLALTLVFLATGSGIKAYRHAYVQIGPREDPRILAADSAQGRPPADSMGSGPALSGRTDSLAAGSTPAAASAAIATLITASPSTATLSPSESREGVLSSDAKPTANPSFANADRDPAATHRHSASAHKAAFTGKISLNQASPVSLTAIRGIGEKTAQVIVQYRKEHGPFRDLRDLLRVKGIGEKKLEKIVPFLIL